MATSQTTMTCTQIQVQRAQACMHTHIHRNIHTNVDTHRLKKATHILSSQIDDKLNNFNVVNLSSGLDSHRDHQVRMTSHEGMLEMQKKKLWNLIMDS